MVRVRAGDNFGLIISAFLSKLKNFPEKNKPKSETTVFVTAAPSYFDIILRYGNRRGFFFFFVAPKRSISNFSIFGRDVGNYLNYLEFSCAKKHIFCRKNSLAYIKKKCKLRMI